MDNNYAEQAIRPFTIGRKNFVLIESSNAARASAMLYSLVETAKANHLNVYQYTLSYCSPRYQSTWTTPLWTSSMIFSLGLLLFRKPVQVDLRNLNFSMYKKYIEISLFPAEMQGFAL